MKAMTDQGAVGDAIRTQDSFTNQMKRLSRAFLDFRVQLGRDIIPALTGLVEAAGNALETFNGLSDGTRKSILVFATFLATVGPIALVVGKLTLALATLRTALIAARVASLALLGPWGIAIGLAAGLAAVVGIELFSATEKATASTAGLQAEIDKFSPTLPNQTSAAGDFAGAIKGVGKEAEDTAKKLQQLRKDAMSVFTDVAEDEASAKRDLAEAIIGQEQTISDIKREIRDLEEQDSSKANDRRLSELYNRLEQEEEALQNSANLKTQLADEVAEAERRASLTAFEREVEDINRRRVERLKDLVARLLEIQQEIAEEEAKNAAIAASYAAAQAQMRAETKKTTLTIETEAATQKQHIESGISAFNRLGTVSVSTPAYRGARADGGPVSSGSAYLVGERGPELFVPGASGHIIPNGGPGALVGGGVTVNITGGYFLSDDAAVRIGDEIVRKLKLSNKLA